MRKRFLHLAAYFFLCASFIIAQTPSVNDSVYFDNFFSRYRSFIDKDSSQAIDSLEKIKTLAQEKKFHPAISRYYLEKAALSIRLYKNSEAISYYDSALLYAQKQNSKEELANTYLTIGNYYQYNGNTIAAAENYIQAIQLFKELGRKRTLVGLYVNLYIIMNRLQQKNVALSNALSAFNTNKKNEEDLVQIINKTGSEEVGFNFPDQTLLKEVGRDPIYVIFGNAKFAITSFENMGHYGSFRDVQRIPPGTISHIPDFPRNGSIMRELDSKYIYVAMKDTLYQIESIDVLESYGGWDGVYFLPPGSLQKFPKSDKYVTLDNRYNTFQFSQEFDIIADSIRSALKKNIRLSNDLSYAVAARNKTLQKKNTVIWATAIGLSALLIIVILLIRNFRQQQKINQQSLLAQKAEQDLQHKMELEKERTRIATDMHDDLGAGLSRIKFLSETIGIKKQQHQPIEEDISHIREYSHEMIDKMGEIVWALNEKNDSLSDLISYTRSYAVEYLSTHGIKYAVSLPENIPNLQLSGEFRRNIHLAIKEILHNIIKHAQCAHVKISFEINERLEILIADDGVGFDPLNVRPYSNGLTNIKKRMNNIGGIMDLIVNQGTTVKLSAPLPL